VVGALQLERDDIEDIRETRKRQPKERDLRRALPTDRRRRPT
jgi:hypothetical protein